MNILIDGCIFVEFDQGGVLDFWHFAIPRLPSLLPGHTTYLLNREPSVRFPGALGLRNLHAPRPEWARSAIEDRRLAALCQELSIDVFVSTCCTSAGGRVSSLFVSTEPETGAWEDVQIQALAAESKERANGFAAWRWTLPTAGAMEQTTLTRQLADALIRAATWQTPVGERPRRAALEELTARQADELHEAELQHFIAADQAYREGLARKAQSPHGMLNRAYWALRQPHRYTEYAIRMLEGLGLRRR
jgi:hypothetical protein